MMMGLRGVYLQIASINSEIRSKVIAENEDGEKLWEV